jgi:phosphate transport system permease protein
MGNIFWKRGEPFVWATGAALSAILLMAIILFAVVVINGVGVFWPSHLVSVTLQDGQVLLGERIRTETDPETGGLRQQFKVGNRDLYGLDFRWIDESDIQARAVPKNAVAVERSEYGNFYGFLKELRLSEISVNPALAPWQALGEALRQVKSHRQKIDRLDKEISRLNNRTEAVQQQLAKLQYRKMPESSPKFKNLLQQRAGLQSEFDRTVAVLNEQEGALAANKVVLADANGREKEISLHEIVRIYRPNDMSLSGKMFFYLGKVWELLTDEPRESNTEGGLFPAIFGTVMMVFLMSLLSFPLGVITGVYLREYAKEGLMVRMVRVAVNNLAGIPSIVYGIFGLGFFVYGIGASIDHLFFPERLPTPTFGTGGILWASLTLGLLTVPVVIVATEEALGAIPNGIREGSLALGATKFQTLYKLLLPMASPGIMTGFILAMARAAGEVAPLMITGVVKLAPALPLDGNFPYFHLDRKFMHLGFHIYDIGFQSPNVEAAKPMVFITTLLLLLIVALMCSSAIHLRNKMRKKYAMGSAI